ncbi:hypothetical protein EHM69_04855, partial [candidate division KSB1 bacterium]
MYGLAPAAPCGTTSSNSMNYDRSHLDQPGFRARRAQNWVSLGLLYAAYYMCRYNITIANPILRETFDWSKEQLGGILTDG